MYPAQSMLPALSLAASAEAEASPAPGLDLEAEAMTAFREQQDPEAFDELMRLHMARVRGVIYNIVLDRSETDDICQKKMADLNARDLDHARRMIEGTARSMGLNVVD